MFDASHTPCPKFMVIVVLRLSSYVHRIPYTINSPHTSHPPRPSPPANVHPASKPTVTSLHIRTLNPKP
jgi:hypothetical protein